MRVVGGGGGKEEKIARGADSAVTKNNTNFITISSHVRSASRFFRSHVGVGIGSHTHVVAVASTMLFANFIRRSRHSRARSFAFFFSRGVSRLLVSHALSSRRRNNSRRGGRGGRGKRVAQVSKQGYVSLAFPRRRRHRRETVPSSWWGKILGFFALRRRPAAVVADGPPRKT